MNPDRNITALGSLLHGQKDVGLFVFPKVTSMSEWLTLRFVHPIENYPCICAYRSLRAIESSSYVQALVKYSSHFNPCMVRIHDYLLELHWLGPL